MDPPSRVECLLAIDLAKHHAARGEMDRARAYLHRAAQADPTNPNLAVVRKRIGW